MHWKNCDFDHPSSWRGWRVIKPEVRKEKSFYDTMREKYNSNPKMDDYFDEFKNGITNRGIDLGDRWEAFDSYLNVQKKRVTTNRYFMPEDFEDCAEEIFLRAVGLPRNSETYQITTAEYFVSGLEDLIGEEFNGIELTRKHIHEIMENILQEEAYHIRF